MKNFLGFLVIILLFPACKPKSNNIAEAEENEVIIGREKGTTKTTFLPPFEIDSTHQKVLFKFSDIQGEWIWIRKSTNWGNIETAQKGALERSLVFKENNRIEFYENGKLTHVDSYEIIPSKNAYDRFPLLFLTLKNKKFTLSISENELRLSEPNCICGCITDEYYKS